MVADISLILNSIIASIPLEYRAVVSVMVLAIIITLYALFIWKVYRIIAHKDILRLNLARYNQSEHPFFSKFFAFILYLIEYIIILPFFIFFWFAVFALIIFVMLEDSSVSTALNLAAAVIIAVRILAYHRKELAEELAKLFPLTVLVVFVTRAEITPLGFFVDAIVQLPQFLGSIVYYFVLIAAFELLMRILDMLFDYEEN